MTAIIPSSVRDRLLCLLTVMVAAVFLFADARTVPVVLWDESRVAVNALEMHLNGWSVVTSYAGQPDLWNTKPPLVVWLISAAFAAFGPSEWALRLPSMLAAMGTLAIVFGFTLRHTGKRHVAVIATFVLALSVVFFGEQGARTADYGALLTFFSTLCLMLLFGALHRRRPSAGRLSGVSAAAALGVMTKGIAIVLAGAGVAGHLAVTGRWRRVLTDWRYAAFGLLALVPVAIFLLAREQAGPGFLAATFANDAGGRFSQDLILSNRSPLFYVDALFVRGAFSLGLWTLLVPLALFAAKRRTRLVLSFVLWCAAGQLLILSFAQTRLLHYALPAAPWLAIAFAIAIGQLIEQVRRVNRGRVVELAAAAGCLIVAMQSVAVYANARYTLFPGRQFYPQAGYGALFGELAGRGVREVAVIRDSGAYAPQLRFYDTLWRSRGLAVTKVPALPAGGWVASCDPEAAGTLKRAGARAARYPGCYFMRLVSARPEVAMPPYREALVP